MKDMKSLFIEGENCLVLWKTNLLSLGIVMEKARNSGYVKRLRKLNPVFSIMILFFGISSHSKPSLEEIFRRYIDFDDTLNPKDKIKYHSFFNRFNKDMVTFLREILDNYIESTDFGSLC